MAAILGLLTSLPQLLKLATDVWSYLNKVSGNDPAGYIVKVGQAFSQLNAAQTQEQHSDAAKSIADVIAGGPAK